MTRRRLTWNFSWRDADGVPQYMTTSMYEDVAPHANAARHEFARRNGIPIEGLVADDGMETGMWRGE